jgi:hypothetical protein
MTQRIFYVGSTRYKRINKTTARREYTAGKKIVFCPSNLRPFSFWNPQFITDKATEEEINGEPQDFDKIVNAFEYYNCTNTETGKYTAFYIAE